LSFLAELEAEQSSTEVVLCAKKAEFERICHAPRGEKGMFWFWIWKFEPIFCFALNFAQTNPLLRDRALSVLLKKSWRVMQKWYSVSLRDTLARDGRAPLTLRAANPKIFLSFFLCGSPQTPATRRKEEKKIFGLLRRLP